jgi:hypothetical protein
MAVRGTVRDAQRRLAALDGAYTRAVSNLERANARRAKMLAEHDGLVAAARGEVERIVAAMASEIGADLTATVLGLDAAHVRHLAKGERRATNTSGV